MIIVEGKPDEWLVAFLGFSRKQRRQAGSKGNVCNYLKRYTGMIGMVDEDPGSAQPSYLSKLVEEAVVHDLKILSDSRNNHRVVVICPRLEEWLIRSAKECGLQLSDFGLPTEAKALHKVITHKQPEFRKFLEALEPKSLRFQRLKAYLTE